MSKLHIFDMDGTLLRGSACLLISEHLGVIDKVNEIEELWSQGLVGHAEFYELCLPMWRELSDAVIEDAFSSSDWIEGIEDVFGDINDRGEHSAVITLSPKFFVERLERWGAHLTFGAIVEPNQPLRHVDVVTPEAKPVIAQKLCSERGLALSDCVAYGDSSSDVPLFELLDFSVAMNASPRIDELAAAKYVGWDLRDAYSLARNLLDSSGVSL